MNTETQEILKNDVADIKQQILIQSLKCLKYSFNGSFDRMYNAVNRAVAIKMANKHENQKTFNGIVKDLHNYNKMLSIDWSEIANTFNHPKQNLIGGKIYSKIIDKLIEKKDIEVYSYGTNWMEKNPTKYCKRFVVPKAFLQNYVANNGTLDGAIEKAISEASNRIKRRIQKKFGDVFSLPKEKPDEDQTQPSQPFTLSIKTPMKFKNKQEEDFWNKRIEAITQMANELQALASGKDLSEILPFKTDNVEERIEALPKAPQKAPQQKIQKESKIELKNDFDIGNDIPEETSYISNEWKRTLDSKLDYLVFEKNLSKSYANKISAMLLLKRHYEEDHSFVGSNGNCNYELRNKLDKCIYAAWLQKKITLKDVNANLFFNWKKDYESKLVA